MQRQSSTLVCQKAADAHIAAGNVINSSTFESVTDYESKPEGESLARFIQYLLDDEKSGIYITSNDADFTDEDLAVYEALSSFEYDTNDFLTTVDDYDCRRCTDDLESLIDEDTDSIDVAASGLDLVDCADFKGKTSTEAAKPPKPVRHRKRKNEEVNASTCSAQSRQPSQKKRNNLRTDPLIRAAVSAVLFGGFTVEEACRAIGRPHEHSQVRRYTEYSDPSHEKYYLYQQMNLDASVVPALAPHFKLVGAHREHLPREECPSDFKTCPAELHQAETILDGSCGVYLCTGSNACGCKSSTGLISEYQKIADNRSKRANNRGRK